MKRGILASSRIAEEERPEVDSFVDVKARNGKNFQIVRSSRGRSVGNRKETLRENYGLGKA